MTVMYLMTVSTLDFQEALTVVQFCREVANPNYGFRMQLMKYEEGKLKEVSVGVCCVCMHVCVCCVCVWCVCACACVRVTVCVCVCVYACVCVCVCVCVNFVSGSALL